MERRSAFAEFLDQKLGAGDAPRPATQPSYGHRATVHAFYEFADATKPVGGWRLRHPYVAAAAHDERPADPISRPSRALPVRERTALEQLNALGAALAEDFTADELRSTFRALARAFHPDTHPRSTAAEAAQLSRNFI